jgi:putative tryptophan/tyrosine transport system substrate-binding protein
MDRRIFLAAAVVALASPRFARAQAGGARRIGLLLAEELPSVQREEFRRAFASKGWVEGTNLHVETRSANGDASRLRPLAEELVRLDVALIVSAGTVASLAARSVTQRVPIVAYGVGEPVSSGLVTSLSRPGGNVTGNTLAMDEISAKRVHMLGEMFPGGTRVGILLNPANPVAARVREAEEEACRQSGLVPVHIVVDRSPALEDLIAEARRRGIRVLVTNSDPLFAAPANYARIQRAAVTAGVPLIVDGTAEDDPVLAAFGPEWDEVNAQMASVVDRILKGASPASIAVERPSRFRLSINLRTASRFGIPVPQSLILRANEVFR